MQHTCKDFWQVKHQGTRESLNRRTPVIRAQLELAGFHLNWTGLCVCVVQMVWEQSCELVIMLTEVVENGKVGTQTQGIACGVRFKQLNVIEGRWSRKKPMYLRIYISGLQCSHLGQNSGCKRLSQFHNTCFRFRLKLAIFVSFPFHFSLCLCWNSVFSFFLSVSFSNLLLASPGEMLPVLAGEKLHKGLWQVPGHDSTRAGRQSIHHTEIQATKQPGELTIAASCIM